MLAETDRLNAIRETLPEESLFAEKDWLLSPEPFPIDQKFRGALERLGHQLFAPCLTNCRSERSLGGSRQAPACRVSQVSIDVMSPINRSIVDVLKPGAPTCTFSGIGA